MSYYLGDYTEDNTALNLKFTTRTTAGVPSTLGGTPVVSVYKANGLTQSIAGITLTADFDSVTGLNNVLIDLSADAFYAIGNDYQVVITAGTVNSVSVVGEVVGEFSIENRFDNDTAKATAWTATRAGYMDELAAANIPANIDTLLTRIIGTLAAGTHNPATAAQIAVLSDWINGGRLDLLLDAILVDTAAMQPEIAKFVFTKANELDVNTKSINDATVTGDGNAAPWDGA